MDDKYKDLMAIILQMIKEVYQRTIQLEEVLNSGSVQILSRSFDPLNEMLNAIEYPPTKVTLVYELIQVYLEDEMTLQEIMIGIEDGLKEPMKEATISS
ncbi:hypothetical protein SAMN05444487_1216 [Marininema mesophilum]|uniref:Uncharacterized protein n=1 Tax=Marininema mesophilum TaxID=1048340 RepID=A0A1H3C9M2_9BACL|nr:hypothetical protein [Marininema mesophilum]SDX50740.1 hypothetical protein SAMN05444487_1216 [Marininema mesophilum]